MGLGSGYPNCGRGQSAHSGGLEGDTTGARTALEFRAALELVKGGGLTGGGVLAAVSPGSPLDRVRVTQLPATAKAR